MDLNLANNVFFKILIKHHKDIYRQACEKSWIICAPLVRSRDGLDRDFIWSHILKPSPLLKLHFTPNYKTDIEDIEWEKAFFLITRTKAKIKDKIKILKEETAYYENNQKITVLIIQKPLIYSKKYDDLVEDISDQVTVENSLKTYDECFQFIHELSPLICREIKDKSLHLTSTYLILPSYLEDAAQRFKAIVDWGIEKFYQTVPNHEIDEEMLNTAVESYVIGLNHDAIFKNIMDKYAIDDDKLYMQLCFLEKANFTLDNLGAQPVFKSLIVGSQIRSQFEDLDTKRSPIEKLYCLKSIYDMTNSSLAEIVHSSTSPLEKHSKSVTIMSDDLLAATIYILIKVKPATLASNINYINLFSWRLPSKNVLGYALVTLEVAMNYIANSVYDNQSSNITSQSNHGSFEDNHFDCQETKTIFNPSLESSEASNDTSSRFSGISLSEQANDEPKLGDFLASLKKKQFIVNYGKQA